jgi:RimJ/RimL family protein N-acetyltransferase
MDLRPATTADLEFIIETESAPEFREYIGRWTREEHTAALREPDVRYLIAIDNSSKPLGFVILRGLTSEHHSIELKRIVMRTPGLGHGKQALQLAMRTVFEDLHAHRLWLDVFESNLRAAHVYRCVGFQQDGIFREAVFRDGKYHSLLLMSLIDREYQERVTPQKR